MDPNFSDFKACKFEFRDFKGTRTFLHLFFLCDVQDAQVKFFCDIPGRANIEIWDAKIIGILKRSKRANLNF